ncbi:hypothetical protein G9A89_019530 [Geosiphon pyriformis]|nr:hypothetical protein G9A89_019530 [Geosiphon pyriformis]
MSDNDKVLELSSPKFNESNQLSPFKSYMSEKWSFNLAKLFVLNIELSTMSGKTVSDKLISVKKIFYSVDGFGRASTSSKFSNIIKSFFTSDLSLKKAKKLAVNENILVNNDVRQINKCTNWKIVVKKIPVNLSKSAVESVFSKFSEIVLIKIQLIGFWQKILVEFESLNIASLVASKWSVFMEKDSVHVVLATSKLAAIGSISVFKGVNLCWAGLFLACRTKYKHFGHISDVFLADKVMAGM